MEINKSLNKKNLADTVIKAIIYNTIIDIFKIEKNIDLRKYLTSTKFVWEIFLVKTTKPIINTELYLLNTKIKKVCLDKLNKLWFKFKNFDIKYK